MKFSRKLTGFLAAFSMAALSLPTSSHAAFNLWFQPALLTAPFVTSGTGFASPTAQPAAQGSSAAVGYADNAVANWDDVPFRMASGVTVHCVLAYHASGISKVTFVLDGGAPVDVPKALPNGPAATRYDGSVATAEYCVRTSDTGLADGQHELRAIVYPIAGVPRVLQSTSVVGLTAGQAVLTSPAHGLMIKKAVLVSGSTDSGLPNGSYNVALGGFKPAGYALVPAAASSPSQGGSITVGAQTKINQTNTFTGGQAILLGTNYGDYYGLPTGLSPSTPYYVCSGSTLTSSSFAIAATLADANGSCNGVASSGSLSATLNIQPVAVPNGDGSGQAVVTFAGAGGYENNIRAGGSMWFSTNAYGGIATVTRYVDPTNGTQTDTGCGVSAGSAACKTIFQAVYSMAKLGLSTSYTTGAGSDGCEVFTRSGHNLVYGDQVNPQSGTFPADSIVPRAGVTTVVGGTQTLYVINVTSSSFELSAKPGGACLPTSASAGYSSSVSLRLDESFAKILLAPGNYVHEASSNDRGFDSVTGWVDVAPAPGVAMSQVSLSTFYEAWKVQRIHMMVNIAPQTATLTVQADAAANSSSLTVSGMPSNYQPYMWQISGAGSGYCVLGGMISSYTAGSPNGTLNLPYTTYDVCPAGSTINLISNTSINARNLWFDGMSATGPGSSGYYSWLSGGFSQGGDSLFLTNVAVKEYSTVAPIATLARNLFVDDPSSIAFNNAQTVVNPITHGMGVWQLLNLTTTQGYDSANPHRLYFNPSDLQKIKPLQAGWHMSNDTTTSCNTSGNGYISGRGSINYAQVSGFNMTTGTVDIYGTVPSTCPQGYSMTIGTGSHPDYWFSTENSSNSMLVGSLTPGVSSSYSFVGGSVGVRQDGLTIDNNSGGGGIFTQTTSSGGVSNDMAVVGNEIGFQNNAILMGNAQQNWLFLNNTIDATGTPNYPWGGAPFRQSNPGFYFINNACAASVGPYLSNAVSDANKSGGSNQFQNRFVVQGGTC